MQNIGLYMGGHRVYNKNIGNEVLPGSTGFEPPEFEHTNSIWLMTSAEYAGDTSLFLLEFKMSCCEKTEEFLCLHHWD